MTGHDLEMRIDEEATAEEIGQYSLKCKICKSIVKIGVIEKIGETANTTPTEFTYEFEGKYWVSTTEGVEPRGYYFDGTYVTITENQHSDTFTIIRPYSVDDMFIDSTPYRYADGVFELIGRVSSQNLSFKEVSKEEFYALFIQYEMPQ
jgi:hypothetical protein